MRNLIVAALVLAVLYFANPDKADHVKAINARATEKSGELIGAIQSIANAVDPDLEYHNFYLFSTVTRRENLVSVGLLKMVFPAKE
ncbi:MAG: hypothetical protein IT577_14505 [Verrucomicrobiae bacterium]|nr:hypothetical protein [Verrucomicrobiae bacterium]